ncbi:MAG: molybdate ABC transporter substrate-binding protein [Bacteroidetes bacterium GWF2_33_16]|nr:MAG: molybdate ABC transporter substrate-binding protein [Bacteroidetes bacterium GWE2_32_14]OFY08738.1 MAG: molybdate ABC transporter substrate-binding protein [Bacteroidetes bacterium GWF2_33_16]
MKKTKSAIAFLIIVSILGASCSQKTDKNEKLIIFHAGSLSVPFKQMKDEFEKENPGVEVLLESAGSVQCARKITDLKKDCDIMASADYKVIDEMLIPDFTNWNIKFAGNEMAIVFHDQSKYAGEINTENWYEILLRDDVFFGRSDPNSDPCGYRTVLISQLAQEYYKIPGLSEIIISKNNEYIRPKEVDLLALLESGTIDYLFLYRSVAQQHNLNYLVLPDSINLKNPDLANYYKTASTNIVGKEPGTAITVNGEPMVYGITILQNAPNKELAIKFVQFILSDVGAKIMEENGQPLITPSSSETYSFIPEKLKIFAKEIK